MEEKEIVIKVREGNDSAFAVLYDKYWLKVYNFTQLYITSSVEVSEVVQDVFVKVWETRHALDETKSIDGLLFIITRNLIFNYTRKHFNEINFQLTALKGVETSYNMEDELSAADLKEYIDSLILQLPPQRQKVYRMSREQNLSNQEIADHCGITVKAVERNIMFALKFIKENLPFFIIFVKL